MTWDVTVNGGFLQWGYLQIIHLNGHFHHKLSFLGTPHLWKPPNGCYRSPVPTVAGLPDQRAGDGLEESPRTVHNALARPVEVRGDKGSDIQGPIGRW